MAAHKVIQVASNGTKSEYTGKTSSAGAGDSGEFIVADASGKLDPSFLPNGVGADTTTLVAGEALTAGDFVYIDGTSQVFKADATTPGKAARGYVLANVLLAGNATVFFDESNSGVTSKTPGATQYLSSTPGLATETPSTTSGHIVQELGFATTATNIHVAIKEPVTRV